MSGDVSTSPNKRNQRTPDQCWIKQHGHVNRDWYRPLAIELSGNMRCAPDLGNLHFLLCLIFTLRCLGYSFDRHRIRYLPLNVLEIVCAGSLKLVQFLSTGFRAKMQWYRICLTSLMFLDAHPYLCWFLNVFIPVSIEENVSGRLINSGIQLVLMSLKIQNIFPYSSPWNHVKPSWIHYESLWKSRWYPSKWWTMNAYTVHNC